MLIIFWVLMLIWLIFEGYESFRDKQVSTSFIAWLAIVFLGALTVGFPK
jgi:hypothetical protein